MRYYLSLDQGGHSSRAILFDESGRTVASNSNPVSIDYPRPGFAVQPAAPLVESLRHSAEQLVRGVTPGIRKAIDSVSLVCQRSSIAFWDPQDSHPLTPIISWQDRRGMAELDRAVATLSPDEIRNITGLFPNPHYGASKLQWLLRRHPELAEPGVRYGPLAGFLVDSLLSEPVGRVDAVNASRTMLMNVERQEWDASLLSLFTVYEDQLPLISPNLSDFGCLEIADISLPLHFVSGDQNAALYAQGEPEPDCVHMAVGTGAFLLLPLTNDGKVPSRLLKTLLNVDKTASFAAEGTVNAAATAIDWLLQQSLRQVPEQALDGLLSNASGELIFINGLGGMGSPFWVADSEALTGFIDLQSGERIPVLEQDFTEQLAAAIESIVFSMAYNLQLIQAAGNPVTGIRLSGGLAGLEGLCQRLADCTQLVVERHEDLESAARGAAYWLADCPASWGEALDGRQFVPSHNDALLQRYQYWLESMPPRD